MNWKTNLQLKYWRARMLLNQAKAKFGVKVYLFRHWLFYWGLDSEGDVTFRIAGVLNFTKYKEHTVFNWGRNICVGPAPKYLD